MIIDAHVQFWKYKKGAYPWITSNMDMLKEDFLPENFSLTAKRNEIDGVVAVNAHPAEVETRFLVELSKTHPIINGVVGWIDLANEYVNEKLAFFSQYPVIKGWYIDLQNNPGLLADANFLQGINEVQSLNQTCDLQVNHDQLPAIVEFFSRFPQQECVITHCAKPDIRHGAMDEWKFLIREIAKHPNAYCKISGLFTQASWKQWSAGDFYPYLDVVFESFGTDRLLYASDWPVLLLSGIYVQWKSLLENYMKDFAEEEKEKVFGLNAKRFYNLNTGLSL